MPGFPPLALLFQLLLCPRAPGDNPLVPRNSGLCFTWHLEAKKDHADSRPWAVFFSAPVRKQGGGRWVCVWGVPAACRQRPCQPAGWASWAGRQDNPATIVYVMSKPGGQGKQEGRQPTGHLLVTAIHPRPPRPG